MEFCWTTRVPPSFTIESERSLIKEAALSSGPTAISTISRVRASRCSALTAANGDKLKLADGTEADWRNDLGHKILAAQRENGSWLNDNGRWMESNPVLVTAYTVLSLEGIYDSIPE